MGTARLLIALLATTLLVAPRAAESGCGCDKPPPPVAAIRPAHASPGNTVTLFATGLKAGVKYKVTFKNGLISKSVYGVAALKRDFANGVYKVQVSVAMPSLPLGPTSVSVWYGTKRLLEVAKTGFTTLQAPIVLNEEDAVTIASCYRAAVGSDGTVYFPFDISGVVERMVFEGFGKGYPLAFSAQDISIYNTQGVLMQLLGPDNASIYAITDEHGAKDSFSLMYDRHEFVTYRAAHVHQGTLALDVKDPAWHVDGTRHIDHDHLVVAIRGRMKTDGSIPRPGATNTFDLDVTTALDDGVTGLLRNLLWSTECLLTGLL